MQQLASHKIHKQIFTLLKQKISDPSANSHPLEAEILKSVNKQDYIDIVNRLTLTDNLSQNGVIDILNYAQTSGKYGVPVVHFQDTSKKWEEKVRIYLLDLNKMLKEVTQSLQESWRCCRKILDRVSSFPPKKEPENSQISVLAKKIKTFVLELDNNKYTVNKFNPNQPKVETNPVTANPPWVKSAEKPKNEEIKLQEPEMKKQSSSVLSADPELKEKLLHHLMHFISTRSLSEMKIIEKDVDNLTVKKNQYLQLKSAIKFFIRDRQIAEEEESSPTIRKDDPDYDKFNELKNTISRLNLQKGELEGDKVALNKQINTIKIEKTQLTAEIQALKSQISKRIQNQLKIESQVKKLQFELESQRMKSGSTISTSSLETSRQSSGVTSEELKRIPSESPEQFQVIIDIIQKYQLLEKKLRQEREKLTSENVQLQQKVVSYQKELGNYQMESKREKIKNKELEEIVGQLRGELKNTSGGSVTIPAFAIEEKLYKGQIQKLSAEKEEYRRFTQQFWIEEKMYQNQLKKIEREKVEMKQQFSEQLKKARTENNAGSDSGLPTPALIVDLQLHKSQVRKLTTQNEELKSSIQQFWLQKRAYESRVKNLVEENQVLKTSKPSSENIEISNLPTPALIVDLQLHKSQVRKLTTENEELKASIQQFWLQKRTYESRVKNLTEEVQNIKKSQKGQQNLPTPAILVDLQLHRSQVRKLTEENSELKSSIQQFWIEKRTYELRVNKLTDENQILKTGKKGDAKNETISNLPVPALQVDIQLQKSQIRKLNEQNAELKTSIQQFWLERKTYEAKIKSSNENIKQLEEELNKYKTGKNPEEKVSAVVVIDEEKYKKQIDRLRKQRDQAKASVKYEPWQAEKKFKAELQQLKMDNQERKMTTELLEMENTQYKSKIYELEEKVNQLQKALSSKAKSSAGLPTPAFIVDLQLQKSQVRKLTEQNSELKSSIQQFWLQRKTYESRIKNQTEEIEKLKNSKQSQENLPTPAILVDLQLHRSQVRKLTQQNEELRGSIQQFWIEKKTFESRIKSLNETNEQLKKEKSGNKPEQIPMNNLPIPAIQIDLHLHKSQVRKLTSENEELRSSIQQFWIERRGYEFRVKSLIQKNEQLKNVEKEKKKYESAYNRAWNEKRELELQVTKLISQRDEQRNSLIQIRGEKGQLQYQVKSLEKSKESPSSLDNLRKEKNKEIEDLNKQLSKLKLSIIESSQHYLFNEDIFVNREEQKKSLIRIVNEYHENKQVLSEAKLLYRFEAEKQIDFHKNIDNIEGILVVVETKNTIIGGYYAGWLGQKEPLGKSSFLFSIKQKDFYPCTAPKKAITYDKSSIIFGNTDLKITPSTQKIFSNFAYPTTYFNPKNKTLTRFLREGEEREASFIKLEVYQVSFSNPNSSKTIEKIVSNLSPKTLPKPEQYSMMQERQSEIRTSQISSPERKSQIQDESQLSESELSERQQDLLTFIMNEFIYKNQIEKKQTQISSLKKSSDLESMLLKKSKSLKDENKKLEKLHKQKNKKIQSLEEKLAQMALSIFQSQQVSLFNGQIFERDENGRKSLVNLVNNYFKNKAVINRTKMIFKLDPLNPTNFHKYIDNIENLLVVVQTKNTIIGAFYAGCFGEKEPSKKDAFLFSLSENETYPCKKPEKAISYDKYFLIFGNSELRITPENQQIFSNFATLNSFYDKKDKTISDFLKEGDTREASFMHLQVYQLFFTESGEK